MDGVRVFSRQGGRWTGWVAGLAPLALAVGIVAFLWSGGKPGHGVRTVVEAASGWPRTLVETFPDGSTGLRVTLASPPQRIVSVLMATDEILLDLVAPERIAALCYLSRDKNALIAGRISAVRAFVDADPERIIALRPDLVFLASFTKQETKAMLQDTGIPVFTFHCFDTLEDIRKNILVVGAAVGEDEKAKALVSEMDRRLAAVAAGQPPRDKWPRALAFGHDGWVAGRNTTLTGILEAAGALNAAAEAGIEGHTQMSIEKVLTMDPDYLLVMTGSGAMGPQEGGLLSHPGMAGLRAVREKRLLVVDANLLSCVSHHVVKAVEEIARQLRPEGGQP